MARLLGMLIALISAAPAFASLTINEFLSQNETGIADEDGDHIDWLELHNGGAEPEPIGGYGLSDDPLEPMKWVLPALTLQPDEHLLVFASGKDRRIWARYWETVIDWGDTWKYRVWNSAPPANWRTLGYDDSGWSSGPSGFGNSDGDDATELPPPITSCHLRRLFVVDAAEEVTHLFLHVDYDDAFVAYLNGVEIARANIGVPGLPPAYNQLASSHHEAWIFRGGRPDGYYLAPPPGLLADGLNVLAMEVHNAQSSGDLTLIPFLTLGLAGPPFGGGQGVAEILAPMMPRLHSNFQLSQDGETLLISSPQGTPLDQAQTGYLPADLSRGRQPDGGPEWFIFDAPTPGGSNEGAHAWEGVAPMPDFSLLPGFYDQPIEISLSRSDTLAALFYTLDGSIPGDSANINSFTYTAPFSIDTTTALRARAFLPDHLPSPVKTATYFIGEDISLPVVSLTTDPDNLWDPDSGIYVLGDSADADWPYYGANFWQDWERPVHFEYFDENGDLGINLDAGVKIHGGTSRAFPQKSLRIIARDLYGPDRITYPFFSEREFGRFKHLILRNSGQDFPRTHCRDGLASRIAASTDLERMAYEPAIVFINGVYWGIQNIRERIDEYWLGQVYGIDPDSINIVESDCSEVVGDCHAWNDMIDFVEASDLADSSAYAQIKTLMEVENFAEWNVFETFMTNLDWPNHNNRRWRPMAADGRWRWIFLDLDAALGADIGPEFNGLHYAIDHDGYPPYWSVMLLQNLLANPDFRDTFVNCYADHLNSSFRWARTLPILDAVKARIAPEVPRHRERWDLPAGDWEAEVQIMRSFLIARPAYARAQLASELELGENYHLTLDIFPPGSGSIRLSAITVDHLWTGDYFSGTPVSLTAQPAPGFAFSGWSQDNLPPWPQISIDPAGDYALTAYFESNLSSAVVINEINYNSSASMNSEDWIEFHNPGPDAHDLSGWIFKDEQDDHAFVFPEGSLLPSQGYLVLCRDSALFHLIFPDVDNAMGSLDFGFSGSGELLRLFDAAGALVDSVRYSDSPPWPMEPDGHGPTLELINPATDNAVAESWAASSGHGTPGSVNSVTATGAPGGSDVPGALVFERPFPNPFNPGTRFTFALPRAGRVSLKIYDPQGRCLATPLDALAQAGRHQLDWQAGNLASGVYFARLKSGPESATWKLLLMK